MVDSPLCDAPRSGRKPRGVRDGNDSPPPSPATHPATATRGSLPDPRPPHHDLILPATGPRRGNPGLGSKHRQRPTVPRASVPYAAPTVPPERPHSSPAVASSPAPSGSPRTARPPQALPAGPGRGEADSALQSGARHAADLPPPAREEGDGRGCELAAPCIVRTPAFERPLRGTHPPRTVWSLRAVVGLKRALTALRRPPSPLGRAVPCRWSRRGRGARQPGGPSWAPRPAGATPLPLGFQGPRRRTNRRALCRHRSTEP